MEIAYPDKGNYIGQVKDSSTRHGKGLYKYPNGDVYFGDWNEDNFHGKGTFNTNLGTYAFKSGDVYEGELKNNLK